MKKRVGFDNRGVVLILMLMVSVITAAGCGKKDAQDSDAVGSDDVTTVIYEKMTYDGLTVTVTDSAGRTVDVPYDPEHIACLYATTGHMVTMLDRGKNIVAVNNGLKRDKLLNQLEPAIEDAALTVVSGQINIESLLEKDVTLAFIPLDIYADKRQVEQLETLGMPYVVVDYQSISEQLEAVECIGQIVGNEEEATRYREFYDEVITLLGERLEI